MFEERQSLTLLLNWEQKLHFFISESRMADWHDAMSMRTHGQSNLIIIENSNIDYFNGLAPVFLTSTNATKLTCIHSNNTFLLFESEKQTRYLCLHAKHRQRKHLM